MIRGIYIFFITFILHISCANAQVPGNVPPRFSQFIIYKSQINPAALPDFIYRISLASGQQNYLGPLNVVKTIFAEGSLTLPKENGQRHAVGLLLFSHKEGELLSYSRAYFQYAFLLPLSEDWQLSSGIKGGFVQFLAEQTATSVQNSNFAPDATIGLQIQKDGFKAGFLVDQMLNATIKQDIEKLKLNRLYGLNLEKKFLIGPESAFSLSTIVKAGSGNRLFGDLTATLLLKHHFLAGIGVGQGFGKGLFMNLGLVDFSIYKGSFSTVFSYNSPYLSSTSRNIETVEVSVRYKFSKFVKEITEPAEEE